MFAPGGSARAQETGEAQRYFGGHQFIPSTLVPNPFEMTNLTSTTGFGTTLNLDVPVVKLDGEKVGEVTSNIAFMLLQFDYQHSIGDRYAVRGDVVATTRVGTSAAALLVEGLSALYGWGFGGSARLVTKPSWRLAATADVRSNNLFKMSPIGFVRELVTGVSNGDSTLVQAGEDSLLVSGNNIRLLGGLRGVYTPTPSLGFQGFFEAGMGDRFTGDTSKKTAINGGAGVSFDLNPLKGIPLGFLGSYRGEKISERGDDAGTANTVGLGFFYTGRRYFSVGLENCWARIRQPGSSRKFDGYTARFVLSYDFN